LNLTYGVSINSNKLANELKKEEIPEELRDVIIKIEKKEDF
jgi:hypothetical protein